MNRKVLDSDRDRKMLRCIRDLQWRFMERVHSHGTLWWCIWNKARRPELPDEYRNCLFIGMDILSWIDQHKDWFLVGEWSDERYACPVQLTDAGRDALKNREAYDMEPVSGGLAEPGFIGIPAAQKLLDGAGVVTV